MSRKHPDAPRVGIVMGSDSDWPVMKAAGEALEEFDVAYEADVVSAHRMPDEMLAYGRDAASRGLSVIIAGAGGAAHLPGMLASVTPLPVIGVPVALKYLDGMDSLLSIVQMPAGVPVATVAVGNARNAGLLAVRILAATDADLQQRMLDFQAELRATAQAKGKAVRGESAHNRSASSPAPARAAPWCGHAGSSRPAGVAASRARASSAPAAGEAGRGRRARGRRGARAPRRGCGAGNGAPRRWR